MNYAFKMFLILFLSAQMAKARPIIVVSFQKQKEKAQKVLKTLEHELGFPAILLSKKEQSPSCHPIREVLMQICVNDFGELSNPVANRAALRNLRRFIKNEKQQKKEKK